MRGEAYPGRVQEGERVLLWHTQSVPLTDMVSAILATLEVRDPATGSHSQRVARISALLGEHLGFCSERRQRLFVAASLHDIGKIGVPDGVLHKPGRLTPREQLWVQQHPRTGFEILEKISLLRGVARFVLYHHERYDGQGYPDGLQGEAIPLESRIIAVADAYDAMTSPRPYREALEESWARREILAHTEEQFDPQVVWAFEAVAHRIPAPPGKGTVPSRESRGGDPDHDERMHSRRIPGIDRVQDRNEVAELLA